MSKDIIDQLARARPAHLDPDLPLDPEVKDRELAAAFTALRGAGTAVPPSALGGGRASSAGGRWRPRRRLVLGLAVVAAAATALAVALSGVSAPSQPAYTLDVFLTVHPQAHPGDAAAVLRRLAARAAAQPARALGPVEYSSNRKWNFVGNNIPRNLNYFSRMSVTNQAWDAVSGASAIHIVRNSDGKVFTSSYPATRWSAQMGAWINPATLTDNPLALRRRLLYPPGLVKTSWEATYTERVRNRHGKLGPPQEIATGASASRLDIVKDIRSYKKLAHIYHDVITDVQIHKVGPFGYLTWQVVFVSNAIRFMSGEPLSPAVHSTMLEVLAQIAANPGRGYTYVDMGTATDHLGRTGVVIGQEQASSAGPQFVGVQSLIFDPRTGALLDVANAQCKIPMGAIPKATGQCVPTNYTEFSLPKAVPAIPRYQAHIPGLYLQAGGPYD